MSDSGLKGARSLTEKGFYYDNLVEMSECCHEDRGDDVLVTAYVLYTVFKKLAEEVGEGPVIVSELRKLEARYRTAVNIALEKAISGAAPDDQVKALSKLIRLLWNPDQ
jgi:hypothetical protein